MAQRATWWALALWRPLCPRPVLPKHLDAKNLVRGSPRAHSAHARLNKGSHDLFGRSHGRPEKTDPPSKFLTRSPPFTRLRNKQGKRLRNGRILPHQGPIDRRPALENTWIRTGGRQRAAWTFTVRLDADCLFQYVAEQATHRRPEVAKPRIRSAQSGIENRFFSECRGAQGVTAP